MILLLMKKYYKNFLYNNIIDNTGIYSPFSSIRI